MLAVRLKGADGESVEVSNEGAVHVIAYPYPPSDLDKYPSAWSQWFTDDGSADGSNNMIVDGSSSPVEFFVSSRSDKDIWIHRISVRISDPGANLKLFGALPELSNGVDFFSESRDEGRVYIETGIKTNLDFIRLSGGNPAFGTGTDSFKADISGGGGEDTYIPNIYPREIFGMMSGLRIRKGTEGKAGFIVNDNLAGLATFNIKATGYVI